MKKTTIIAVAIITLYSCAKKMTPTTNAVKETAVVKPIETPKPEELRTVMIDNTERQQPVEVVAAVNKESEMVVAGKEVFKAKCGRCHDLKAPENYTASKWVKIIDWMAPKAKLDASEKENILAYGSFYAKSGS
jgi:mono/diheme cytochrome c family protein